MADRDSNARPASTYRPRRRHGRCYELAYRFQSDDPAWLLVHGTVRINGSHSGHAWLERDGSVYDVVLDITARRAEYVTRFAAVTLAAYSRKEAAEHALATRHFGPWAGGEG